MLWLLVVGEKHISRILGLRGEQYHALPTLGESERLCVYDTVGPEVAARFELVDQEPHATPSVELEHERHVLQHQPPGPFAARVEEPEHVANESRVLASNPRCPSRLTQVLAREASCNEVDIAHCLDVPHIADDPTFRKVLAKDSGGALVDLTEECGTVTGLAKAKLNPADAGEQSCYGE